MRTWQLVPLVFIVLLVSACDPYKAEVSRLDAFAGLGKIGSSPDFWMEKFNFAGEWEKTILVFGYADDYQACLDLVAAWTAKYPLDSYRCTPAN
jgi:hypothetical protein